MLGVRRTTLTVVAGALQEGGLIGIVEAAFRSLTGQGSKKESLRMLRRDPAAHRGGAIQFSFIVGAALTRCAGA
jgi:hypothetical protein